MGEDMFDSSVNLEQFHIKEGYDLGYKDGLVSGKDEAWQVGLQHGFRVGEELGFYKGCVDIWDSAIAIQPELFSPRVRKSIQTMENLIGRYPLMDPEDESAQDIMESLRLQFKRICVTLGVKLDYIGYPMSSSQDVAF
uniref:Essential protein Yae1 N-terminal domain-containing protein n=1 Tax=Kalanchoe fedtschenkoi TaxID=63787 RepID=A0A7N0UKR7_KALFE